MVLIKPLYVLSLIIVIECQLFKAWQSNKSYKITGHHVEAEYVSRKYIKNFKAINSKYNRTTRSFGLSFELKRNLSDQVMSTLISYKFINNEYKEFVPLRVSYKMCDIFKFDILGMKQHFNNVCPLLKGRYNIQNIVLDGGKLFPGIPPGDYKISVTSSDNGEDIMKMSWFGGISN